MGTPRVPARAQEKGPANGTGITAQALIEIENKWVTGLIKSDTATLDAIFADGYVDTDEHSQRSEKQGVLSVLKSGDRVHKTFRYEGVRLRTAMRQW